MKCPIDGNNLEKNIYEGQVEIDQCNSCNGAWLDKGELEKIQNLSTNDYKAELEKIPDYLGNAFSLATAKSKDTVSCPVCDTELERREYGYSSQVMIDACINGHGIWLDNNELKALEVFYEKSRLDTSEMKTSFLFGLREFLGI